MPERTSPALEVRLVETAKSAFSMAASYASAAASQVRREFLHRQFIAEKHGFKVEREAGAVRGACPATGRKSCDFRRGKQVVFHK
jgi:hypothetical protein